VKFLVEECLSPELVAIARERGHWEMTHVTSDFTALLDREKLHPGLVCLNVAPGLMSLDVQKRLFALALERLGDSEPINEIIEITLRPDRTVLVERYVWHSGQ
jgi:hypothetical protein